jgi:hypothetical protein
MMNSEVRIVPGSAVCDRHRTNPKNPTERCSVAAFIRKPQIDLFTPTLHHSITPGHSSLIKPNQAISCLDAIQSQPPAPSTSSTPSMPSANLDQIRNPSRCIGTMRNFSQSQSKPVKAFPNRYLRATVPAAATIYCGLFGQIHNPLRFAAAAYTNTAMHSAISVKPSSASPIQPIQPIRPIPAIRNPQSAIAVSST